MAFLVYLLATWLIALCVHTVSGWDLRWTLPLGLSVAMPLALFLEQLDICRQRSQCAELCRAGQDASVIASAFEKLRVRDSAAVTAVGVIAVAVPIAVVIARIYNGPFVWAVSIIGGAAFAAGIVSEKLGDRLATRDRAANSIIEKAWQACAREPCRVAREITRERKAIKQEWHSHFGTIKMNWPSMDYLPLRNDGGWSSAQLWPSVCCSCGTALGPAGQEALTITDHVRLSTKVAVYKLELPVCPRRSCRTDPVNGWSRPEPTLSAEYSPLGGKWIIRNLHDDFMQAAIALNPDTMDDH